MEKMALSVTEAAKLLGVSPKLVYNLCHAEGFPAFRVGSRTVVSRAGLERWVQEQAEKQNGLTVGVIREEGST